MNPQVAIRDLKQLEETPAFAYESVAGFQRVEALLAETLRYVPFCAAHHAVHSPVFSNIIIEAASQCDSLWKAVARRNGNQKARLDICDYQKDWAPELAKQQIIFFAGDSPQLIHPFSTWQSKESASPNWWFAYNALKHDRFSNLEKGTQLQAVESVSALLLACLYSGACDYALSSSQLVDTSDHNPWAYTETGMLRDLSHECPAIIDSDLFVHPLAVFDCDEPFRSYWNSRSIRFNTWWILNSKKLRLGV